ncbi:MAG TPA: (d)CMP kinase [Acidobacteriaceae bacterium]|jgi:cytidylate kinase|nr:(d)CMP kinase [Acidobacteriaceae bacterium]
MTEAEQIHATAMRRLPVIAIDGPAGAGKSTLAAHLARKFGFLNLETGAMYRALALKAIESDTGFEDEAALAALFSTTTIQLQPQSEGNRVLLDGQDVSLRVRERDVAEAASLVSMHPRVREWMVAQQRALGSKGGVVMEGRDIGTKVFPDAEVKIFLDAAPEVRGQRRFRQGGAAQPAVTEEAVIAAMRERDARDRSRAASPLEPAPDAVILDSTAMTFEEVTARCEEIIRQKLAAVVS